MKKHETVYSKVLAGRVLSKQSTAKRFFFFYQTKHLDTELSRELFEYKGSTVQTKTTNNE